ncbi:MAG: 2-oxo acid dehydrogenase subunit E2 [Bacteroidales bacterium]|nr:2-oxo acid dehydrogenase subunit E2 [Bacteroidales bacterium]
MATAIIMPKQGQSVESCIISVWHKKKGDKVEKGDVLFSYETDKASFDEESTESGILLEVFYGEGDEVPVLTNVAVIGNKGEKTDEFKPAGSTNESEKLKPEPEKKKDTEKKVVVKATATDGKIKISPLARRIAKEKGIALSNITGSGPKGRIIVRDLESAKTSTAAAIAAIIEPGPFEADHDYTDMKLSNIRKLIANAMYASLQNTAQLTHHLSADARKILALRKKIKSLAKEGYKHDITLNDMICYAVIKALQKHPDANVHFIGDSIRKFNNVHLGLAVDTDRGLMVPAVRNADKLTLTKLSAQLKAVALACKNGSINPDLLSSQAATFTVSNLGNYGVEMFTPVLNMPQAGILGVNTIINRPALTEDGTFAFIPYIGLSLTYDHRALDGGPATKFLAEIKNEIENFSTEIV